MPRRSDRDELDRAGVADLSGELRDAVLLVASELVANAVATDWGVRPADGGGKQVWATVTVPLP